MHQKNYIEHRLKNNDMTLLKSARGLPCVDEKRPPEDPYDRGDQKGVLLEGVLVANCRKFFIRATKLKPTLRSPLISSMSLTRML